MAPPLPVASTSESWPFALSACAEGEHPVDRIRDTGKARMGASRSSGNMLLVVWVASTAAVVVAAVLTGWLCPDAAYGYEMLLWSLFLVTPVTYTITAWKQDGEEDRPAGK